MMTRGGAKEAECASAEGVRERRFDSTRQRVADAAAREKYSEPGFH